eukprot:XP_762809.1 hypothetical protein [Theileria parva strain Muguga]
MNPSIMDLEARFEGILPELIELFKSSRISDVRPKTLSIYIAKEILEICVVVLWKTTSCFVGLFYTVKYGSKFQFCFQRTNSTAFKGGRGSRVHCSKG